MRIKGVRITDSIEFRLGAITIVLGLFFLAGTFWIERQELKDALKTQYLELAEQYSETLSRELSNGLEGLTSNQVTSLLYPPVKTKSVPLSASWRIFNDKFIVTHASEKHIVGEKYLLDGGITAFKQGRVNYLRRGWHDKSVDLVIAPLYHSLNHKKIGALELRYDANPIIPYLEKIIFKNRIREAALLAVLVFLIGYLLFRWFILNPLINFKRNIDELRIKQSTDTIPIARNDEIGMLIGSFNSLLNELRINIDELESTKQQTQAYSDELKSAYERLESQISEMKEAKDQITELYMVIEKVNIDLDKKVIELSILNEVGRAISSILDLDQLLNMIIKWATEEMGAHQGAILLSNENHELVIRAVHNLDPGVISQVMEPVDCKKALNGEQQEFLPAITIPLRRKGITAGVINIGAKESGRNFTADDLNLLSTLANQAAIAIENATLYETIQQGYFDTIQALTLAIEAKDVYTRGHSARVTRYAVAIAEKENYSPDNIERLRYAAVLHDIGKIGIREAILRKKGKLSDEEYSIMKKHPTIGESIVEPIVFLSPLKQIIRSHHEWVNGNGYPDGLKGNAICHEARILAVADAYDAMTSNRPYREQMPREQAISELRKHASKQFEASLVKSFIEWLEENHTESEESSLVQAEIRPAFSK